jgi:hypothetical protein
VSAVPRQTKGKVETNNGYLRRARSTCLVSRSKLQLDVVTATRCSGALVTEGTKNAQDTDNFLVTN